jgi:nucleotide-binding universal stress UspA family protein
MSPRSPRGPILVGYDGSDEARDALALARVVATAARVPLVLTWVEPVGPFDIPYDAVFQPIQARAEDALAEVAQTLRREGFEVRTRVGLLGSVAEGIHEFAEEASAQLVVVGSSHRGRVGRVLAGTVGTRLFHGSPCPVAVAPRGLARQALSLKRMGVGYDGAPESQLALSWAERLARAAGAQLDLLVVSDEEVSSAERALADGLDRVTDVHADGAVKHGSAAEELLGLSERVDLLVVGSRGHGPLRRVLLGSVSAHLVAHSSCPIVVAPRGAVEHRRPTAAGTVSA